MSVKMQTIEYVFIALLILFILTDVKLPSTIGQYVDTTIGSVILISGAVYIFHIQKVLGAVAIIAAVEILRRTNGIRAIKQFVPSELKRSINLSSWNQFPITLEEEIVRDQLPVVNKIYSRPSFKPKLANIQDAVEL